MFGLVTEQVGVSVNISVRKHSQPELGEKCTPEEPTQEQRQITGSLYLIAKKNIIEGKEHRT